MEHLLSVWPKISDLLSSARRIILLSDYDGTLSPIVDRPELANLPESTRHLLRRLSHQRHISVGIISGRALSDLQEKVSINGIIYAGNHGMEIESPRVSFISPLAEELRPFLRIMHYILHQALGKFRGVIVENKGLTLSVHYRMVPKDKAKEVESTVKRVLGNAQAQGRVKITPGKKVYEIRPEVDWDKGKAIKLLMKKYGKGGRQSGLLPIYLGDDLTDEDGFRVIEKYGNGISVFVGQLERATVARYYLESSLEVETFLGQLLENTRRRSG